jgi:hypothetical protein
MRPPAPRPCESCPYRRDVPSGLWHAEEYAKLPLYDRPTGEQPMGVFQCHQNDGGAEQARVCAGWAGCHGTELLALRIAVIEGRLPVSVMTYSTTVPLFPSGQAAAEHGMRDLECPSLDAALAMGKILAKRTDLDEEE